MKWSLSEKLSFPLVFLRHRAIQNLLFFFLLPVFGFCTLDPGTIGSSQCINSGNAPAPFTSTLDASGGAGISYIWEKSTDNFNLDINNFVGVGSTYTELSTLSVTTYYRRRVSNSSAETGVSNTIVVSIRPVVTGISPTTPTICEGQTTFPVTLFVTNNPSEYKIDWSAPALLASFNDVVYAPNNFPGNGSITVAVPGTAPPASYFGTLTLRSAITVSGSTNYCASDPGIAPFIINQNPTISVQPSITNQSACLNNVLPNLSITASVGSGTFSSIEWFSNLTNSNSSGSLVSLQATPSFPNTFTPSTGSVGSLYYYAVIKNSNNCSVVSNVSGLNTVNALPIIAITPTFSAVTVGMTTTLTAAGADTYIWSPIASLSPTTGTTVTATPTITTQYIATGTISATGCINTATTTITVNPVLTAGGVTAPTSACINTSPGVISSTSPASGGTGAISYQWESSTDNATFINIPGANAITYTPGAINQTTYYRRGAFTTVDAIVYTASATVLINPLPILSIVPAANAITVGLTTTLTASGADGYVWSPAASLSLPTGTSVIAAPLTTTLYTITGTVFATGCINSASITITVNPVLTAGSISSVQTICFNTAPVGLTSTSLALGGTGTITYQWQESTDNVVFTNIAGANAISYAPGLLTQTTYYRRNASTIMDGIVSTSSIKITVEATVGGAINGSISVCTNVNSTNLTLTGQSGSVIKWQYALDPTFVSPIDIVNATAFLTASNLTVTTYYRAVVQLNSCAIVNSSLATITVNALPTATITASGPTTFCSGGSVNLTASGGVTYLWSTGSTLSTISVNTSGNRTVTVTDVNGCSTTSVPTTITVNALPTATITASGPTIFCSGGSVNLTASGGVSYLWSTGSSLNTISVNTSGNRTVTVTDVNGCSTTSAPTTITVNALPTAIITASGPTTFCSGGSVNLSVSGGVSYLWSTGSTLSTIVANTSGNRTVTVTDVNGCSATSVPTTITVNALPTASITASGPTTFCSGGSVNLTANGGVSFLWSTGSTLSTISANTSGNRTVTVTDVNGCSATSVPTAITVHTLPVATITAGGPVSFCIGGTVQLSASGANTYLWNNGANTKNITVSSTGNYTVTVTDIQGCSATSTPTAVSALLKPVINIHPPVPVCNPATVDLTSAAITSGSTAGLVFTQWTDAVASIPLNTPNSISVSNTYYIKGTDPILGCTDIQPVNVQINPLPILNINTPAAVCAPLSIDLTSNSIIAGSSGVSTYSYFTDANASVTVVDPQSIKQSGTFYIKGITSLSCSVTKPVSIVINPLPVLQINQPTAVCNPGTVNLLLPSITNGSTNGLTLTYWRDSLSNILLPSPSAVSISGTYYIKGVLPTGCARIAPVTATVLISPVLNINNPNPVCEPSTVDITAPSVTNGSSSGLQFSYWTDLANTQTLVSPIQINSTGKYYIKGTAANGCSASLPVTVTINPLPNGILQDAPVNFICNGLARVLNASNAFSYQWYKDQQPISNATGSNYSATVAGDYTVRFFSIEGCSKDAVKTIRLDLLVKPVLQYTIDKQCINSNITFFNQSTYSNSGGILWQWDFGDGSTSNAFSASHIYQQKGNYSISLSANAVDCPNLSEIKTINYKIESPLPGIRYATLNTAKNRPIVIPARNFGTAYLWQPSTGLNNDKIPSPTAILNADIEYQINITTPTGCVTVDTIAIRIDGFSGIFVASGFTPNGDGLNDRCFPQLVGIRTLNYFKIFNRWGNVIFQTNDATPQNGWDGKVHGIKQPPGTYTWAAEGIDGEGNILRKNGNVLLIN